MTKIKCGVPCKCK